MEKLEVLNRYFGYSAFRAGQEALIDAVLSGGDAFGIMPTGAGKSICYQVPAMLLDGLTLVISPLISLMQDQVTALVQAGIPAAYINSALSPAQLQEALRRMEAGRYRLVYVSPERLATARFQELCARLPIRFVAVDEAHCISQWGQDFRPDYLRIPAFIAALRERPIIGAYTATATERVKEDIEQRLGLRRPTRITTGFDRPNLFFAVEKPKNKNEALLRLLAERRGSSGIIYCATRKKVEAVCRLLRENGYTAGMYHAGLEKDARVSAQNDFLCDRLQIMTATNAFGMGIDKSNVAFVIHYNMPKSLEAYYQEAGRAGRDGSAADCVLLYSPGDVSTQRYLINHSEPNPALSPEEQDAAYRQDLLRLEQMKQYATGGRCLRTTMLRYFGETVETPCGHCSVCRKTSQAEDNAVRRRQKNAETADPKLFEALRRLRAELAKEQRCAAFMIFSDATLRDMCGKRPTTLQKFLEVSGVGESKAKKYGAAFLACIAEHGPEVSARKRRANSADLSPFRLPPEERERFAFSDEPIGIAMITRKINELIDRDAMQGLKCSAITAFLLRQGLLAETEQGDGKRARMPTKTGRVLGIRTEQRTGANGAYTAVLYGRAAQRYILDHLDEITSVEKP